MRCSARTGDGQSSAVDGGAKLVYAFVLPEVRHGRKRSAVLREVRRTARGGGVRRGSVGREGARAAQGRARHPDSARAVRPADARRRHGGARGRGRGGGRAPRARRRCHRRDLPAPGVAGVPGVRAARRGAGRAERPGGEGLLPDHDGPLGPSQGVRAVPRQRSAPAGSGLLSGGHEQGGVRDLDRRTPRRPRRVHLAGDGDPAPGDGTDRGAVLAGVPRPPRERGRRVAGRGRRHAEREPAELPLAAGGRRSSPTTTTPRTWPGWTSTRRSRS